MRRRRPIKAKQAEIDAIVGEVPQALKDELEELQTGMADIEDELVEELTTELTDIIDRRAGDTWGDQVAGNMVQEIVVTVLQDFRNGGGGVGSEEFVVWEDDL